MEIRRDIFSGCETEAELQQAWRKVAFEIHPDKGGSALKFQQARELYEQRKREIAEAAKMAANRAKAMAYMGLAGALMQDIAEGKDWTENAKKMIPEKYKEYAVGVDILNALLKTHKK